MPYGETIRYCISVVSTPIILIDAFRLTLFYLIICCDGMHAITGQLKQLSESLARCKVTLNQLVYDASPEENAPSHRGEGN
jgi:hypothetical protein